MRVKNLFFAFLSLTILSACEASNSEPTLEQLRTYDGIGPGEVSIDQCNTPICLEFKGQGKTDFVNACMAATGLGSQSQQRAYCECVRDDVYAHNSVQTLIRASVNDTGLFAVPNIDRCIARSFS